MKNYKTETITRQLSKNRQLKVNTSKQTIKVLIDQNTIGNATWGKIDFLEKKGYMVSKIREL